MGARNPESHAKRARELSVKERRERKRAKKAEHHSTRTLRSIASCVTASLLDDLLVVRHALSRYEIVGRDFRSRQQNRETMR